MKEKKFKTLRSLSKGAIYVWLENKEQRYDKLIRAYMYIKLNGKYTWSRSYQITVKRITELQHILARTRQHEGYSTKYRGPGDNVLILNKKQWDDIDRIIKESQETPSNG